MEQIQFPLFRNECFETRTRIFPNHSNPNPCPGGTIPVHVLVVLFSLV